MQKCLSKKKNCPGFESIFCGKLAPALGLFFVFTGYIRIRKIYEVLDAHAVKRMKLIQSTAVRSLVENIANCYHTKLMHKVVRWEEKRKSRVRTLTPEGYS